MQMVLPRKTSQGLDWLWYLQKERRMSMPLCYHS